MSDWQAAVLLVQMQRLEEQANARERDAWDVIRAVAKIRENTAELRSG